MTRDDILQALRITAMGRYGHPLQEQFADQLVSVFERLPKEHMDGCGIPGECEADKEWNKLPLGVVEVQTLTPDSSKRRPGRPKKAD